MVLYPRELLPGRWLGKIVSSSRESDSQTEAAAFGQPVESLHHLEVQVSLLSQQKKNPAS